MNILAIIFGLLIASLGLMHWYLYHVTMISDVSLYWLSLRYVLAFAGAFIVGYISRDVRVAYWLLLIIPAVLIEHILFLVEADRVSNLWPPILFADILLFSICFPFMLVGKKLNNKV